MCYVFVGFYLCVVCYFEFYLWDMCYVLLLVFYLWDICYCWFFINEICVIVCFLLMKYVLLLVFYLWNMCYCWFFIDEICVIVGFLLMCYVLCVIVVFYLCACGKLKWQEGIARSLLKCWTFFPLLPKLKPQ